MTDLHPSFNDIIPSVVTVVFRRYKNFVERKDLSQEAYAFAAQRGAKFAEQLDEPNEELRKANEKRIGYQIKRHLERYCRKEKAHKSGYTTQDEAFYETVTIAQLLPYVIASVVNDTALEQAQNLINDGQPRKPAAPAEGGTLLAILVDIKKAYELLEQDEKDILRLRYHENHTLQMLAQYFECSISTAERRANASLRKLQNNLGGQSPWV
jgi:RNA polymerase sigma factor (sigma-70 family)